MSFYIQCPSFLEATSGVASHYFWGNIENNFTAQQQIATSVLGPLPFITLQQIHSNKIILIESGFYPATLEGDALITNQKGIILGIKTADCVPLLLIDDKNLIIAAIHVGWRGAVHGIINNTVLTMQKMGAKPQNIKAVLGPCIQQFSYEVTLKFKADLLTFSHTYDKFFATASTGNVYFNLPYFVKEELKKIQIEKVHDCNINTYTTNFCSYRRMKHNNIPYSYTNLALFMLIEPHLASWYNVIKGLVPLTTKAPKKVFFFNSTLAKSEIFPPKIPLQNTFPELTDSLPYTLDKNTLTKLKRGTYPIHGRLDLHGLYLDEAYEALHEFIITNYQKGSRGLLVITGKGSKGDGVIRQKFYNWVEAPEIKKFLLYYIEAAPHHGGKGAFYILLKKNR